MLPQDSVGDALSAIAARIGAGGDGSLTGMPDRFGGWLVTLVSVLALIAAGRVAALVAQRLARSSTPELMLLLEQSAAFYGRWPETRLAHTPRSELLTEAARCQRIVDLLQQRCAVDDSPALQGPVDGLKSWITLLHARIEHTAETVAGPSYA